MPASPRPRPERASATWVTAFAASVFNRRASSASSELNDTSTPAERVAFCNTGSEAVLATFRIARTVTGRDTIVVFEGGYHGHHDEVMVSMKPSLVA